MTTLVADPANQFRFKMFELHGIIVVQFADGTPTVSYDYGGSRADTPELTMRDEIVFEGQPGVWTCNASDGVLATLIQR